MVEIKSSPLKAFALLNGGASAVLEKQGSIDLMPTAKARNALERLIASSPQDLASENLKPLCQDLLNWDGHNRVNKPLVKQFADLLGDPKTYSAMVEFAGYLSALAPFFEADTMARMCAVVPNTATAFAPTAYTVAFNRNLATVLQGLSVERKEKIAFSLWNEAHSGRWWNMTAGVTHAEHQQAGVVNGAAIVKALIKYGANQDMENAEAPAELSWTAQRQAAFTSEVGRKLSQGVALTAERYRDSLARGHAVNPDVAIFLSAVPWLSPLQRPESPINSLLSLLVEIRNDKDFIAPSKPNSIKDLFPSLSFYIAQATKKEFPMEPQVAALAMAPLGRSGKISLIENRGQLAQNANFMSNCTASYQANMKAGTYALFVCTDGTETYNVSLIIRNNRWVIQEAKARHNRPMPRQVRDAFEHHVKSLAPVSNEYQEVLKLRKESGDGKGSAAVYRYRVF